MLYNSAADSFRTKQLCSTLSFRYRAKTGIKRSLCVFDPPFGGLEAGYDVDHRLIGKHVGLPISDIELFSLAVTLVELRAKAPF